MTILEPKPATGACLGNSGARIDPRDAGVGQCFLDFLVRLGLLDGMAAERALQAQQRTGERIDSVVLELGLVTDIDLLEAMGGFFDLPVAGADAYPDEVILPDVLPEAFLRRCRLVPAGLTAEGIKLIAADPFAVDSVQAVSYMIDRPVALMVGNPKDVDGAITRLYGHASGAREERSTPQEAAQAQEDDVQRLRDIASEAPIIRLVNRLISSAIEQRASDIHIEPQIDCLRVRFRIDGVMAETERLAPDVHAGIASRIKILSRLNIAERRLPQDGRIKFVHGGREVDIRVATAPVLHGEKIVMRILDRNAVELDFAALGFDAAACGALGSLLGIPNGIILVTGPTGSGKTTTLYAALRLLNRVERNVFTVEDPIEYQLPGVNQVQIRPAIGLDFVDCLRSILRQDPDVIMIGEMRDTETARVGIQAALTGHLVISTLHTNSAAASATRLLDMGVEDYLLGSTLSAVVAQRLVRTLCPDCAAPDVDFLAGIDLLPRDLAELAGTIREPTPRRPVGCGACRGTGYRGRTTIYEILVVDDVIRARLTHGVTAGFIEEAARSGGMETLLQCGLRKVMAGQTTMSEVMRVAKV